MSEKLQEEGEPVDDEETGVRFAEEGCNVGVNVGWNAGVNEGCDVGVNVRGDVGAGEGCTVSGVGASETQYRCSVSFLQTQKGSSRLGCVHAQDSPPCPQ